MFSDYILSDLLDYRLIIHAGRPSPDHRLAGAPARAMSAEGREAQDIDRSLLRPEPRPRQVSGEEDLGQDPQRRPRGGAGLLPRPRSRQSS